MEGQINLAVWIATLWTWKDCVQNTYIIRRNTFWKIQISVFYEKLLLNLPNSFNLFFTLLFLKHSPPEFWQTNNAAPCSTKKSFLCCSLFLYLQHKMWISTRYSNFRYILCFVAKRGFWGNRNVVYLALIILWQGFFFELPSIKWIALLPLPLDSSFSTAFPAANTRFHMMRYHLTLHNIILL